MQKPIRIHTRFARLALPLAIVAATGAPVFSGLAAAAPPDAQTTTPITHVVVIYQENVSFDHYFATYPRAANPVGEPAFTAAPDTPSVNGLTPALQSNNPNAAQPARLDRTQAVTCDMDHNYTDEQKATDGGLMDKFFPDTQGKHCGSVTTMDYYDGNTVTALWNYAQHFALNDNFFGSTFGASTPGALNLASGQTHGATASGSTLNVINGTDIGDLDPTFDDCSTTKGVLMTMAGPNVGDLLNARGITWGWFEGGFKPTSTTNGKAVCGATTTNVGGAKVTDYIPHHEPFQYYRSTANPHHLPPSSVAMIGQNDQANHQYDLTDFWAAAQSGNLPAASFLKAKAAQDGHAGYSDPVDEQAFLVDTINRLERLPTWNRTAVIISYDDSDGWYDHVMPPIVNHSNATADVACGTTATGAYEGRCGYGPRLPLLIISPYAKANDVDNSLTDQSSILRFIEDNWSLGRIGDQSFDTLAGPLTNMFDFRAPRNPALILDPSTGIPTAGGAVEMTAGAHAGMGSVSATIPAGGWIAYQLTYPGDGSQLGVTLTYTTGDPNPDRVVTVDAYGPGALPPSGKPIGSGTLPGKPGAKYWQLGSSTAGRYVLLVRNTSNDSSATIQLATSAVQTGAAAPALTVVSASQ